jgi:hypothetical protein
MFNNLGLVIGASVAGIVLLTVPAIAKDVAMTGDELKALLSPGKTIMLGGAGEGYSGELAINADGTAKGRATTDDGKKTFNIEGTWLIKGNKFCRTWKELDGGKENCESWIKSGENKVIVKVGKKKLGVNHW